MGCSGLAGLLAQAALAEPSPGIAYPPSANTTRFDGLAFDTCAAPSRNAMRAWRSSPYGAVGIYISGPLRACRQHHLTPQWVREVSAMGWKLLPLDVGLQAPCADNRRLRPMSISTATAGGQGVAAARRALAAAGDLGLLPGSALYSDIEAYNRHDARCHRAVRSYVSGWTRTLHAAGYLSGVYGNLSSAVHGLSEGYLEPGHTRPDAIWSAHWDRRRDLGSWRGIPARHWGVHQRIKQYRGDHDETHGGFRITIDSNVLDAPVASVAHRHIVVAAGTAEGRDLPDHGAAARRTHRPGAAVQAVCRVRSSSGSWLKLVDGSYLPGPALARAPGSRSAPPACAVAVPVGAPVLNTRAGPDVEAEVTGFTTAGSLAWITCQAPGITLGRPGYWHRLTDGRWVSGALLAAATPGSRITAVPLCPG